MKEIICPKCGSNDVGIKVSWGGFSIYNALQCNKCKFEGGRVVVYEGELERVERETKERFVLNNKKDDVKAFVNAIAGHLINN